MARAALPRPHFRPLRIGAADSAEHAEAQTIPFRLARLVLEGEAIEVDGGAPAPRFADVARIDLADEPSCISLAPFGAGHGGTLACFVGTRGRVILAKLLLEGWNLIALDEPTNDLDLATLRALEEALMVFPGAALVVTHDRWFLDRLATHIMAFEGDSHVEWFEGNFEAYEEDKKRRLGADSLIPHRIKFQKFSR